MRVKQCPRCMDDMVLVEDTWMCDNCGHEEPAKEEDLPPKQ